MTQISGIKPNQAGWLLRLLYKMVQSQTQKLAGKADLAEALQLAAHRPSILAGVGAMEMAQMAAKSLPAKLKSLASLRTSTLIGCPY
jgi:alkylhydroperoxidase family enzyme